MVNEKEERGEDGTIVVCLVDPGSFPIHFNQFTKEPTIECIRYLDENLVKVSR